MMILSLDFETTGLDREADRITEVGAVLWSTKIHRAVDTTSFLVDAGRAIPKEVTELTGISDPLVKKFGRTEDGAIEEVVALMHMAHAVIGQNVVQFDKPFLENAGKRLDIPIPDMLWIDTRTDLPPSVESKSLVYMATDHNFLNPFPHNAVSDGLTVLKIADMYDWDAIVARAKEPNVVISSQQSFDQNSEAKKLKFGWKANFKKWVRVVKQSDLDSLAAAAPFRITVETGITPQQVWYS